MCFLDRVVYGNPYCVHPHRSTRHSLGNPLAVAPRLEQEILVEDICQRMRGGGYQPSYGSLDGATAGRILQRLADLRALTPIMLAAFRGCPVASLSLDRNPRVTNALLNELGRKVGVGLGQGEGE